MVKCEIETVKRPGDLVLSGTGQLFRVGDDGRTYPHETERRRMMRERSERVRAAFQQRFAA